MAICDKPCSTCPWRRENQTREAILASPLGGDGQHWFALANLRRHWRAVSQRGHMMPCHATDKNAPLYGGKFTPVKTGRVCVGLSILAHREVTRLMASGTDFAGYRRAGGRWSAAALAAWAARLYYAGSAFHAGRDQLTMPIVEEDVLVKLPWEAVDSYSR